MKNIQKGIALIITSAFCFALMTLFVRLAGDIPSIQKSFFRNALAFVIAFVIHSKNKGSFKPKKENLPDLILRSLFGTVGIICNYYAVDHLILSDAALLNKMSPFFVIIFSYLILKEKITLTQVSIVVGAFIGSLFVIKPTFANAQVIPSIIGFIGGISAGMAYTFVRKLGKKNEASSFIVLFFSGFSCLSVLPIILVSYVHMTLSQFGFLMLAGISAAAAQFAITMAYSAAPASKISVYDYSQIIFSAILGFMIYGQVPDKWSFLGYSIIILMAIIMFIYNHNRDTVKQS